jgi:hypothetical protein
MRKGRSWAQYRSAPGAFHLHGFTQRRGLEWASGTGPWRAPSGMTSRVLAAPFAEVWGARRLGAGQRGRNPGDMETQRPGDPATRRPGDPATRRPGDPATQRPGDPVIQRPSDPATRRPSDPAIRRPGDPESHPSNRARFRQTEPSGSQRSARTRLRCSRAP